MMKSQFYGFKKAENKNPTPKYIISKKWKIMFLSLCYDAGKTHKNTKYKEQKAKTMEVLCYYCIALVLLLPEPM